MTGAAPRSRLADRMRLRHALLEAVSRWPFRRKLTLLLLMSSAMALLTASAALILSHYHNDRQSADRRFAQIADVIASNLTAAIVFDDADTVREILTSVRRIADIDAVHVYDADGREIGETVKPGHEGAPGADHRMPASKASQAGITIANARVLAPVMLNGVRVGTVAFDVSRSSFAENFSASYQVAIAVFLLGLGLSFGVGLVLRSMVFGPIERLTETMQAIGDSGDFSTRLEDERDPDFQRIAQSFNYMLSEIESRQEQLSAALAEVRAARDAEQISEAKSQFMANMSHELRTPLNAIIGYAEVLKEDLAETELAHSREDVGWIYSSARQLMALINGVLDFSKISAGKMAIEVQSFALEPLLAEVEAMLEPMAAASGNALEVRLAHPVGLLKTDPTKLRQCLLNLGSNACKFTQNGTIRITVREVGESIVFDVADSGKGIEAALIPSLFEPFTQGDASITRKYGGTGLGLPITRELARLMGGTVSVESMPGQGSVFTLEIRRQVPAGGVPMPAEAPKGVPILVIDAQPEDFGQLARIAETRGYRLILAQDPGEAPEIIRHHHPRLLILDLDMAAIGQSALPDALRSDPAMSDLPVVTTSRSYRNNRPIDVDACEHLAKPLDEDRFMALLALYTRPQHGTILIVEDDPATAALYRRAVEQIGFTVMVAASCETALELIEQVQPALIISDLGLPGMSGFDLVDTVASLRPGRVIPILVMTGRKLSREQIARLHGKTVELEFKGGLSPRMIAQLAATHALRSEPGQPPSEKG